jgi:predicted TIM-barrel fold metal-dependent hydrolase
MSTIYNCHVHVFNARHVPEYFLYGMADGMPKKTAKLVGQLLKTPIMKGLVIKYLEKFGSPAQKKFIEFLRIGVQKTQDVLYENVMANYPAGTRAVLLPLNFKYMGAGEEGIGYEQQLEGLLEVKKKNPDTCLPFVFIDPRMGTPLQNRDFVKKYIDKGFKGIKLYPSLGYYPYDPGLELVYKYAVENNLPVMTHCSRGGIYYNDTLSLQQLHSISMLPQVNSILHKPGTPAVKREYNFTSGPTKEFKNNFLDPENYVDVLLKFPQLKLCFAHFGGDLGELDVKVKDANAWTWYDKIKKLINDPRFPNVFTDISYSLYNTDNMKLFKEDLRVDPAADPEVQACQQHMRSRILFGTDFFMTLQEDKVTEFKLHTDTMQFLGIPDFMQIANTNPVEFMRSAVYKL